MRDGTGTLIKSQILVRNEIIFPAIHSDMIIHHVIIEFHKVIPIFKCSKYLYLYYFVILLFILQNHRSFIIYLFAYVYVSKRTYDTYFMFYYTRDRNV